ncbi:MAG TPA: hypothetical protein VI933_00850 [archaeon]|nr:hypothetical protein [archaeon]
MKNEKKIIIAIAILAFVIRLAFSLQSTDVLIEKVIFDDAFYGYSIANNIIHGNGMSLDGKNPTNGLTPMWTLMISPPFILNDSDLPVKTSLIIASVLDAISVVLIYSLSSFFLKRYRIVPSLIYAVNLFVVAQSLNGLEGALQTTIILLALNFYFKKDIRSRINFVLFGVISGIAILTRTDLIFLLGAFLLDSAVRKERGILFSAKLLGFVILIVSPWFIWSYVNLGTIQQSSALTVYVHYHGFLEKTPYGLEDYPKIISNNFVKTFGAVVHHFGFIYNTGIIVKALSSILVVSTLLFMIIKFSRFRIIDIYIFSLLFFYPVYLWGIHIRYFTPIIPLLLIAMTVLLSELTIFWKRGIHIVLALMIIVIVVNGFFQIDAGYFPWAKISRINLAWIENYTSPDDVIGSFNSGIISYYSNRSVVNLDGVHNHDAIKAILEKDVGGYMKRRNISYWIDGSYVIKNTFEDYLSGKPVNILSESSYKNVIGNDINLKVLNESWGIAKHVSGREMGFVSFIAKVN